MSAYDPYSSSWATEERVDEPADDWEPSSASPLKEEKPLWRKLLRLLWLPLLLIWKGKSVFAALAKVKGFTTLFSMLASIAAYALIWGWQFGVGFVLLLLVHELGHALVLRHHGVKTSPILFIPFLGAVIGLKEMPKDAFKEAQMALGGPVLGSVGALGCLLASYATGSELLQALAYVGFFLNLFNLIPVVPLDGGRAMAAVHPATWYVGAVALLGLVVWFRAWVLLVLFVVFMLPELIRRLKEHRDEQVRKGYYGLSAKKRLGTAFAYVSLAGALAFGMYVSYLPKSLDEARGQTSETTALPVGDCFIYQDEKSGRYRSSLVAPPGSRGPDDVFIGEDGSVYAVVGDERHPIDWVYFRACFW